MLQFYLVLGLIFSMGIAIFAVQNATRVDISLFFWQLTEISLVLVIFSSALIGAIAAGLFGAVKQIKLSRQLRNLTAELENHNVEIGYLRKKLGKLDNAGTTEQISAEENAKKPSC